MNSGLIDFGLWLSYILLIISVVSLIAFPVYFLIKNFRKAKNGLLGVGALFFIIFLSILASPAKEEIVGKIITHAGEVRIISGALIATYILMIITIAALIYSQVSKWFK